MAAVNPGCHTRVSTVWGESKPRAPTDYLEGTDTGGDERVNFSFTRNTSHPSYLSSCPKVGGSRVSVCFGIPKRLCCTAARVSHSTTPWSALSGLHCARRSQNTCTQPDKPGMVQGRLKNDFFAGPGPKATRSDSGSVWEMNPPVVWSSLARKKSPLPSTARLPHRWCLKPAGKLVRGLAC